MRIALRVGKDFGVDEALPIYTSKIEVKEWVGLRYAYDNTDGCTHVVNPLRTRTILQEYKRALLVIGKKSEQFKEALLLMEKELQAHGFYKALALINGPCDFCSSIDLNPELRRRPSLNLMGIDIVATVRRFKKNEPLPKESAVPPYAIILIE